MLIFKFLISQFFSKKNELSEKLKKESATSILESLVQENSEKLSINDRLMMYKEIKYINQITHLKPVYLLTILIICLIILVIGYYENFFTCLIGILYPLR